MNLGMKVLDQALKLLVASNVQRRSISVPMFPQAGLTGIADYHSGDVRFQQIVQPGAPGSFFKGHVLLLVSMPTPP
jgi:hypothetical protein